MASSHTRTIWVKADIADFKRTQFMQLWTPCVKTAQKQIVIRLGLRLFAWCFCSALCPCRFGQAVKSFSTGSAISLQLALCVAVAFFRRLPIPPIRLALAVLYKDRALGVESVASSICELKPWYDKRFEESPFSCDDRPEQNVEKPSWTGETDETSEMGRWGPNESKESNV